MKFEKETKNEEVKVLKRVKPKKLYSDPYENFEVEVVDTPEGLRWIVYDCDGNQVLKTDDPTVACTFV